MEQRHIERKLAAIVAADVAGYSRLMSADEEGTLVQLKGHRRALVDPKIREHRGQIIKTTGDGMLVEFASVVDALRCAVEIQRGMAERNASVPAEKRIEFRIGINLGDVIHDDKDIFGDGVNVAARLEALAEPGGICISRSVRDAVREKLGFTFEDIGDQELKNIAVPIHTYRVRFGGDLPAHAAGVARMPLRRNVVATSTIGVVAVCILAAMAIAVWPRRAPVPTTTQPVAPVASAPLPLPDKPSIAVLPFTNIGGDARQERLADGITEDVITDLSRYRDLFVIARNTMFTYKGKPVNIQQVGRELGVRYVLEGSIQTSGDRVRVTAQLIEAANDAHVWSERYDRPLDDIFEVQNEVTQKIAAALGGMSGSVVAADAASARRKPPASLQAYDCYALGLDLYFRHKKENLPKVRELFNKAIELDPQLARAYAGLGRTYLFEGTVGLGDARAAFEKGVSLEEKAVDLDPTDAMAYALLGEMTLLLGDYDRAFAVFEQALKLNPNNPDILVKFGGNLVLVGRAAEGVEMLNRAFRLNPHNPPFYNDYPDAFYAIRQYEQAIAMIHRRLGNPPLVNQFVLPLAYAQMGELKQAEAAVSELAQRVPDLSVERLFDTVYGGPPRHQPTVEEYLDGARKAGIRECATPEELQKYPKMTHLALCDAKRVTN